MDLSRPVVVHCHSYLPIWPIWVCPWAKNLSNQAALGPDFVEPISLKPLWIYTIPSSMELSKPVVVQHPGHLTLTLDLSRSNLENAVSGMGGPIEMERKGWVNRMLDPHCEFQLWPHPWPWPLIFKVKFWKCCISRMGGSIDMERKGCESIGC